MRLLELFAGTGSVGKAYREKGWETVSLDIEPGHDITCDIMNWDYSQLPKHFDAIHCSPPCTHYSIARTTAKTPRDLEGADAIVQRTLEIIKYFEPKVWTIENPYTGYMKDRPFMFHMKPFLRQVTYCKYGLPYRKATSVWTNLATFWQPRSVCTRSDPCEHMVDGRHLKTAQRGPGRFRGQLRTEDKCSLHELYALPSELCAELAEAATRSIVEQNNLNP